MMCLNGLASNPNFDNRILSVTLAGFCTSQKQQRSTLMAARLPGIFI